MIIRRPPDIPSSEITPEHVYVNRRKFIKAAAAGAAGLAKGAAASADRLNNIDDQLRLQLARYFVQVHLPHADALRDAVVAGAGTVAGATPELLNATGGH